ncbi:hypothetical protein [Streptomyces sp. NBC_00083]|uniref:hypothetical protein n=1 Tax=Streptomyces sp. NBC_00083 TaxID=2975647 RepID=UPI0022564380|nr:hypothetical protein [Streptomyces sp. NBC_00083]MCX5385223.1 hypothetical protein [Streptomyces sp. NBC_00083]
MDVHSTMHRAEDAPESPAEYAVDTANGNRVGVVQERFEGSVYLRPPGGGAGWATSPEALRPPTPAELARVRVLDTPVEGRRRP